jgi:serine/threonine protein phosphatase 1
MARAHCTSSWSVASVPVSGVHFLDAKGPDDLRIYAIGDVHGRLDLLLKMHDAIIEHRARRPAADWRIIHLGDYVDRGADSKGVLDFLIRATDRDARVIALAGNHDVGFLDFLAEPVPDGLFAHNGGRETALSYGVRIDFSDRAALPAQARALRDAVPERHRAFLQGLKFSLEFGDFFFCHAGIRPGVPLDRQEPSDLIWIREVFLNFNGLHPKVIVHGHTPSPEPAVLANRVNVDTGAFRSGMLSALVVEGGDKHIIKVTGWAGLG